MPTVSFQQTQPLRHSCICLFRGRTVFIQVHIFTLIEWLVTSSLRTSLKVSKFQVRTESLLSIKSTIRTTLSFNIHRRIIERIEPMDQLTLLISFFPRSKITLNETEIKLKLNQNEWKWMKKPNVPTTHHPSYLIPIYRTRGFKAGEMTQGRENCSSITTKSISLN